MYYAAVEKILYNWNEFWNRRDIEIVYLDLQVCHRWYWHSSCETTREMVWHGWFGSMLEPLAKKAIPRRGTMQLWWIPTTSWRLKILRVLCGWFFLFLSFLFCSFLFLFLSFLFLTFFFLFISFFYIHYIYIRIYTVFCFVLFFLCVSETSGASLLFSNRDITYPLGMGEVFVHVFGSGGVGIGWGLWCAGACHSIVTRRPLKS